MKSAEQFFQSEVEAYRQTHYDAGHRTFMSVRQERVLGLIDSLAFSSPIHVLDAGCGPGYLSKAMFDRGFSVSAVDTSGPMLELASQLFSHQDDIAFEQGSIESLPYADAAFDVVVSLGVIEYLESDSVALDEFCRVLRPGGTLIVSLTNAGSPVGIFERVIESCKKSPPVLASINWLLKLLGQAPVRPRPFYVRKHQVRTVTRYARDSGFDLQSVRYFYFLPWPHPFDRLFPRVNSTLNRWCEPLTSGPLGRLAEGALIHAIKPR